MLDTTVAENKIRILLVENHPEVSKRIAARLEYEDDLHVCSIATQHTVLAAAKICKPDVILIDPVEQGEFNYELIRDIREALPSSRLIVLTAIVDTVSQVAFREAGIEKVLEKDLNSQELIDFVRFG